MQELQRRLANYEKDKVSLAVSGTVCSYVSLPAGSHDGSVLVRLCRQ